jgi:hypothetical protein
MWWGGAIFVSLNFLQKYKVEILMKQKRKVVKMRFRDVTAPEVITDKLLKTVKCEETGTVKTVTLRTHKGPSDVDALRRDVISKTEFGNYSKLKRLGVDSVEFTKNSKDLVINQVDGKQLKACLKNLGEIDMVRNFFKILKRLH